MEFQALIFDKNNQRLLVEWLPETVYMSAEEYKQEQSKTLDMVLTHRPKHLLIDTRQMSFIITPDLQTWTDEHLVQPCLAAGVNRFAFVMPIGFVEKVAIEQAVEENALQKQLSRFCKTMEEAVQWLAS